MNIAGIAKGLAVMKEALDRAEEFAVSTSRVDPALDGWLKEVTPLPLDERIARLSEVPPALTERLRYCWPFWARPEQLPPTSGWTHWLVLAGRGFGKTRTGAEMVRVWARYHRYVNLIGATADDVRDIQIDGEAGILAVCPRAERPEYKKSERKLIWPSGAITLAFTGEEEDRLRGKQHEKLWCDELAAWRYPGAWDQAKFGLRLGPRPQSIITTTPRPNSLIRGLLADPACVVTRGTSYSNRANLAPAFFSQILVQYEGSRLGRQELNAELLEDNPAALWQRSSIDANRVRIAPPLQRIVVGVDPSVTSTVSSDETGIVVVGASHDGQFFVLAI
jgi:phage terminase large subunit-like protein